MGLEWPTCPVGSARSDWRVQAAMIALRTRQVCGSMDPATLPAWLLFDMSELSRLIEKAARES
jgi:hypothetical protein